MVAGWEAAVSGERRISNTKVVDDLLDTKRRRLALAPKSLRPPRPESVRSGRNVGCPAKVSTPDLQLVGGLRRAP